MKRTFLFLIIAVGVNLYGQEAKKEVLLIGTFHFNNPGQDVIKTNTFNVMTEKSQKELENITDKIELFNPDKVFVEWEYDQQLQLDSLYDLYVKNQYFNFVKEKHPNSSYYIQSEVIQLAFKAAKKCKHTKVYGIDYSYTNFPIDSVMTCMDKTNQILLKNQIEVYFKGLEKMFCEDMQKLSLLPILLKYNEEKSRKNDLGSYITLFNKAGKQDNFAGAYLVSEWYKRNLYMYSLLQKITETKDKKVMVLLGASHVAMFKEFIESDENFKAVELKDILK